MKRYKVKCYECGSVDKFTIQEMSDLHFCQTCYERHDTMCDTFANDVLELEQQNKRYREAIEYIKIELRNFRKDANTIKKLSRDRIVQNEAFRLSCDIRDCLKALEDKE